VTGIYEYTDRSGSLHRFCRACRAVYQERVR
jgi:hypothetical protein